MPDYRIEWSIDVFDAPDPRTAVLMAIEKATLHDDIFTVTQHGGEGHPGKTIDLSEDPEFNDALSENDGK